MGAKVIIKSENIRREIERLEDSATLRLVGGERYSFELQIDGKSYTPRVRWAVGLGEGCYVLRYSNAPELSVREEETLAYVDQYSNLTVLMTIPLI